MKKGRAEKMTHDYQRNGATTLFAAMNVLDGTPRGPKMAGAPSALDIPLHADIGLLAQRRRAPLRDPHQAPSQAWRLPIRGRSAGRHQLLPRRSQRQSKPFQWVADPEKIIEAVRRGHQALDSIH